MKNCQIVMTIAVCVCASVCWGGGGGTKIWPPEMIKIFWPEMETFYNESDVIASTPPFRCTHDKSKHR